MTHDRPGGPLVRDRDTGDLLETLLVMSVVSILINRAFLAMTHYPRIAFGSLHISHMLWGGLLMLIALVMVFRYWNPSVRKLAAFIGGIGFGLFIDELGKFITKDNDYFFQPTIAIIYVVFIAMYLVFRGLLDRRPLSDRELAVNAALRRDIGDTGMVRSRALRLYNASRTRSLDVLHRFLATPRVIPVVMVLYVLGSLLQLGAMFGLVNRGWLPFEDVSGFALVGAASSSTLVLTGLLRARRSREEAAHWLRRAVLVSIFVTQIFLFYRSQLTAIWGLGVNLLVYAVISSYIRRNDRNEAGPQN